MKSGYQPHSPAAQEVNVQLVVRIAEFWRDRFLRSQVAIGLLIGIAEFWRKRCQLVERENHQLRQELARSKRQASHPVVEHLQ